MELTGCRILNTSVTFLTIAAIVIGGLGVFGVKGIMMNPALGWIAVGIGSGILLANVIAKARHSKQNWEDLAFGMLVGGAFIAVGVLGGLYILQSNYLGWAMLGIAVASFAIYNCTCEDNRAKPIEIGCCENKNRDSKVLTLNLEFNCCGNKATYVPLESSKEKK